MKKIYEMVTSAQNLHRQFDVALKRCAFIAQNFCRGKFQIAPGDECAFRFSENTSKNSAPG